MDILYLHFNTEVSVWIGVELLFHGQHDHYSLHPYISVYGFVKYQVKGPPCPKSLPALKLENRTALGLTDVNMLTSAIKDSILLPKYMARTDLLMAHLERNKGQLY